MGTKKPQRNVQQHFVTASYLGGFTPDGDRNSQLYVYERKTEKVFRTIPDKAAKRRNYYSIPKPGGEFDDRIDEMLTKLEEQAMPSLRKLLTRDYDLSMAERALLAYLVAFQEFRTPWARANFQKLELSLMEQLVRFSAKVPGYWECALEELKAQGKVDDSVSATEIRESLENENIKLVAKPHAGIDHMLETSQTVGDFYTQMQWTVIHAKDGEFLTSDAPVSRHNPGHDGGLFGGGLINPTTEVLFPLSKNTYLFICHDQERMQKFSQLLEAGKMEEAKAVRRELPPIKECLVLRPYVNALNRQAILNADRFVYSPFESHEIPRLLKGESQNSRIVVSSPFGKRPTERE